MLTELRIRNVGVIDDVTLTFGPGLNVLTGETGAGKTMVVSALELLLGARADSDRVRAGADAALVEGSISPPPPAAADWLDDADDELVVAREVAAAGAAAARSRARVGGRMAPVSALAACVGDAVELHGQSDTSRLTSSAVQRELLDRFGGAELQEALDAYTATYTALTSTSERLAALRANERDRVREADRLRFELDEIEAVGVAVGEEDDLQSELQRLEHAEALTAAAATAAQAVTVDGGARDAAAAAAGALAQARGFDPELDALAGRMESLLAELEDAGLELHRYAGALELDPARLEWLRERQLALLRLSRKYGEAAPGAIDTAGVVAYAASARAQLEELESGDEHAAALEADVARMSEQMTVRARRLRELRTEAGDRLSDVVGRHLRELAMEGAHLSVEVAPIDPTPSGADRVTFLLAANPGEPALPFGKAASGGERSRVALALRLALADADATPVLVFDEVDAGIGGVTATAVGAKLARLAQGRQVLCVTHLPQLAAHADVHFRVRKSTAGSRTVADVVRLDDDERVTELSRMLSGMPDSPVATDHAAELLATARGRREAAAAP